MDLEKQQQQQHAPNTASLSRPQRFLRYCANDIDKESAFWPLLAYTAIAGYASAVSFCATWTYAAFQSANSVQIGIALGQVLAHGEDTSPITFHENEKLAVASVLSFFAGGLLAQLIPRKYGTRHRGMLILATLAQALLTLLAAVCCRVSNEEHSFAESNFDPNWTSVSGYFTLIFLSASCGLQGVIADLIGTNLGVTVVLTSLWVQMASQPMSLWKPFPRRDQKFAGIVVMILGAVVGRAIAGELSDWHSLFILTAFRVVSAFSFLLCPAEKKEDNEPSEQPPAQTPATSASSSEESTPAASTSPSRNISTVDFSRFNTISSVYTLEDPNNQRNLPQLQQSDTINP